MLSLWLPPRPFPFAADAVPGLRRSARRGHASSGPPACATVGPAGITERASGAGQMPPLWLRAQPRPLAAKPLPCVWRCGGRGSTCPPSQAPPLRPGLHPCGRCRHPCPCPSDRLGILCSGVPAKGKSPIRRSHRDGPASVGRRPSGHADGSRILDAGHTHLHTNDCSHAYPHCHRDTTGDGHGHPDP